MCRACFIRVQRRWIIKHVSEGKTGPSSGGEKQKPGREEVLSVTRSPCRTGWRRRCCAPSLDRRVAPVHTWQRWLNLVVNTNVRLYCVRNCSMAHVTLLSPRKSCLSWKVRPDLQMKHMNKMNEFIPAAAGFASRSSWCSYWLTSLFCLFDFFDLSFILMAIQSGSCSPAAAASVTVQGGFGPPQTAPDEHGGIYFNWQR